METKTSFRPTEVAYFLPGTCSWKFKLVKTERAFERLMLRLHEEGAEVRTRDAGGSDAV